MPTLLTLGCGNGNIPCTTASLYYSNPVLPTSSGSTFNLALPGFKVPGGTMLVVASSTLMYIGSDTTAAGAGGLRKVVGTPSAKAPATGATWSYGMLNGAVGGVLNAPGATGVHGLTGRWEVPAAGGTPTFVLYFTTTGAVAGQSGNNALMRYDTAFDATAAPGPGFTLLAAAPAGGWLMLAVMPAPISASAVPTFTSPIALTVLEHSPAFAVVGVLPFNDALARPAAAFVWTITSDPSDGMFGIVPGELIVANVTAVTAGGGFNYNTGPLSYTVGFSIADATNPFNVLFAYGTAVVNVTECNVASCSVTGTPSSSSSPSTSGLLTMTSSPSRTAFPTLPATASSTFVGSRTPSASVTRTAFPTPVGMPSSMQSHTSTDSRTPGRSKTPTANKTATRTRTATRSSTRSSTAMRSSLHLPTSSRMSTTHKGSESRKSK